MNAQTTNPFAELFAQFGSIDVIKSSSPLLAHYTDIATAEQVITNDTIWLSNPLFMNDISEVRFGIIAGVEIFRANPHVFPAAGSDNRLKIIQTAFETAFAKDRNELSLDSYVFCFSKHDVETDSDGRLSMWRAYGGNGEGAAIVLSTAELANQNGPSPLLLAEVKYKSHEEQRDLLRKIVDQWCAVVKQSNFPDALLDWASYSLFLLIKYFALSYKHRGFAEEQEWRLIYTPDFDQEKVLSKYLSYHNGARGIEPKLKLKLDKIQIPSLGLPSISLNNFLKMIILGPSISSELAKASFVRMLEANNLQHFRPLVHASQIPFRATFRH